MFWQLCDITLFLELSPLNGKSLRPLCLHFSANLWRKPESEISAIDLGFVQLRLLQFWGSFLTHIF